MKIYAEKALLPGGFADDVLVTVDGGYIRETGRGKAKDADICAKILTPGLYDKHEHGALGFDASRPDEEKCRRWLKLLASHGVTNVLYTVSTGDPDRLNKAIDFAARVMEAQKQGDYEGCRIEGVHMEGPFISPVRSGAMAKDKILPPSMENFYRMAGSHADIVKAITIAPEVPGAAETARELASMGIRVQAGHTDATCQEAKKAFNEDCFTGITHFYNAARPMATREPGILGAALFDDRVYCEAICDLVHVSPEMLKLLIGLKTPDRVCVISDSVATAGLPDGEYFAGNHGVIVRDGKNYTASGGIAGGAKQADTGVHNLIQMGIKPEDAFRMASSTTADYFGQSDLGAIAPGMRACLAAWNEEYECEFAEFGMRN